MFQLKTLGTPHALTKPNRFFLRHLFQHVYADPVIGSPATVTNQEPQGSPRVMGGEPLGLRYGSGSLIYIHGYP